MAVGTVLGLAGIDLVLLAAPAMPEHLGGDAARPVRYRSVGGSHGVGATDFWLLWPSFWGIPTASIEKLIARAALESIIKCLRV
jgi:hypothetical protein